MHTLGHDLQDKDYPIEARSLGRTLIRWKKEIAAWHEAHVTNGPTEAVNNLIKRVKRAAVRFTSFHGLPDPLTPVRRQAQLEPARDDHTPLKSEEPKFLEAKHDLPARGALSALGRRSCRERACP